MRNPRGGGTRRSAAWIAIVGMLWCAPASAGVVVTVGEMVVELDPGFGWTMTQAFFEGEPVLPTQSGSANGTAMRTPSGWAGELHGNLVLERAAIAVDDEPLQSLPADGSALTAQKRIRIERSAFLGGAVLARSTIVVTASSIVDQVEVRGISPDHLVTCAYTHLGARANGLTQTEAFDAAGVVQFSMNLDNDDGGFYLLPAETQAIVQSNPATGLHVRTIWSEPTNDGFLLDRATDQKLYHRTRALENAIGRVWSGTQTIHIWRE